MNKSIIIDDTRADVSYGLHVIKGGFTNLLAYPSRKKVSSNNWYERDGIDADLLTPAFGHKDFQMQFFTVGSGNADRFTEKLLSSGGNHVFKFGMLNRTFNLRATGLPMVDIWRNGSANVVVSFSEDNPYLPTDHTPSYLQTTGEDWIAINGKSLREYGVKVLKGSHEALNSRARIKQGLIVNSNYSNGRKHYGKKIHFEAQDVQINCLITAETIEEFWAKYNTLLHTLIQIGELDISFLDLDKEYKGFYKQCQSVLFNVTPIFWWQFKLKFTLTNYRP